MSDDTRRVLDLLAQGKVTVDEADQLLRAIASPDPAGQNEPAGAAAPADKPKARWVRIAVHKQAKEGRTDQDVNIRVPIAIVKSGMRIGALIPGLAGDQVAAKMRERGLDVDFSKLDTAAIESILKELAETNIEIDSGRSHVRITCE
jgi:hypothetical protein